jgi:hypothetical protein
MQASHEPLPRLWPRHLFERQTWPEGLPLKRGEIGGRSATELVRPPHRPGTAPWSDDRVREADRRHRPRPSPARATTRRTAGPTASTRTRTVRAWSARVDGATKRCTQGGA